MFHESPASDTLSLFSGGANSRPRVNIKPPVEREATPIEAPVWAEPTNPPPGRREVGIFIAPGFAEGNTLRSVRQAEKLHLRGLDLIAAVSSRNRFRSPSRPAVSRPA